MKLEILSTNQKQTRELGKILARDLLKTRPKNRALLLGLEGNLGGGKTTFLKGFAGGLGIKEKVLSPTFVIIKNFELRTSNFEHFYHIDCYRIKSSKEILALGFKEIISNPLNIIAVEWADHISKILPKNTLWIKFDFLNKNARKITIY